MALPKLENYTNLVLIYSAIKASKKKVIKNFPTLSEIIQLFMIFIFGFTWTGF